MSILDELAIKYGTDKSSKCHGYADIYSSYFINLRHKDLTILEVGIDKGSSLKMWEEYFYNSHIVGIDINKKCLQYATDRTTILIGDQLDNSFLETIIDNYKFDIIIDDGSHRPKETINTFVKLFPTVNDGGFYIIEDLHCSYDPKFGGGYRKNLTQVEFIKGLLDDIGYDGKITFGNNPKLMMDKNIGYYSRYIASFHYYPGICFFLKRDF